jgi:hypothetical protein
MRSTVHFALFLLVILTGCSHNSPPTPRQASSIPEDQSPLGVPISAAPHDALFGGAPLILDRTDLRIGTTVHFSRIPSRQELYDLHNYSYLAHIVIVLPQWPTAYANLQELDQAPGETDLIVVLPGYPPSQQAADAWNMLSSRVRIVVVVNDLPPGNEVVDDLNKMRGLERVIAQVDDPRRTGFERLQRPLSFRKIVE